MSGESAEVVVIGAGISGCAAALELAEAGRRVVLLDRWGPAAMASGWTLAGVRQSGRHPAELPLAREAVRRWATLAERLDAPTNYMRCGNLRLARTEAEVPVIEALVAEQSAAGLEIVLLRGAEIRAAAPAVSPDVLAASLCPGDGHADPVLTTRAFAAAAERAGAVLRFGEEALDIEAEGGRVSAVRTGRGRIACERVVLAAGVFGNALLAKFGARVPLEVPMVTLVRSVPGPRVLDQVIGVANADCAGRQEADGRWRVTSGRVPWHRTLSERSGRPVVAPTASSLGRTVTLFGGVVPAFLDAHVEQVWAGLIDLTPDALPVLDRVPGAEGLVVGMGFSGHGFCLGPVTGGILAALAEDREPDLPVAPFRLGRFDGWNAPAEPAALHG